MNQSQQINEMLGEAGPKVTVYDNGGKTADRYTVIIKRGKSPEEEEWYGMSDNANAPNGFNQFAGTTADGNRKGSHLGKIVKVTSLPSVVQKAIKNRIEEDD